MGLTHNLIVGSILILFFALFDSLDGILARLIHKQSNFGAFLDSTLDRLVDAFIAGAYIMYFMYVNNIAGVIVSYLLMILGFLVSYTRARSTELDIDAKCGLATRADRIGFTIIATFLVGLGLPNMVLTVTIAVICGLSAVTVTQRILYVKNNTGT
jgi:CDP-diacylglycerol--glycerol-3-phosphate 3-phosphatidyltransferase